MLQLTKELLKETILLLIAINVIRLLIPKWIRMSIRRFTKLVNKGFRGINRYAKKHYITYYKQNKKATQTKIEQPQNVITIIYPDGTKKKYPKAK